MTTTVENQTRDKMPPKVADVFNELHHDIVWHHAKWKIYRQLYAESEDRIQLLGRIAGAVFRAFQDLLFYDTLLTLTKLTEPGKRVSFKNLLKTINPHIHPSFYEELGSDLDLLIEKCKPFKKLRDTMIAHSDLETALGTGPEKLPLVNRKMIDDANMMVSDLMNKVRAHYSLPHSFHEPAFSGDGDWLIRALERGESSPPQ